MKKRAESLSRRYRAAFTLLEVLAAVAILGIWFAVLANTGIRGLRAEGRNLRHIHASLLADQTLAQLEMDIEDGVFPEAGVTELEVGDESEFQVEIETTRFEDAELNDGENALMPLLAEAPTVYAEAHVVEIRVTWLEAYDEEVVTRTTSAWNSAPFNESLATRPDGANGQNPASGGQEALEEPAESGQRGSSGGSSGGRRRRAPRRAPR